MLMLKMVTPRVIVGYMGIKKLVLSKPTDLKDMDNNGFVVNIARVVPKSVPKSSAGENMMST